MPQILNDDNTVTSVDASGAVSSFSPSSAAYSPKFFHKNVLTGKGTKAKGLLCEGRDPKYYQTGYKLKVDGNTQLFTTHNGNLKIYGFPFALIPYDLWEEIDTFDMPAKHEVTLIATKGNENVYLCMPIYAAVVQEQQAVDPNTGAIQVVARDLSASMHMFLFYQKDSNSNTFHQKKTNSQCFANTSQNLFYRELLFNIFSLRNYAIELERNGYIVKKDEMNQFVQGYSLYKEICLAAQRWQDNPEYYIVDVLATSLNKKYGSNSNSHLWKSQWMWNASMFDTLSRLENYKISLDAYKRIFDKMKAVLPQDILNIVCKANLNLRLTNTLNNLNNNRANLANCPCNNHIQSSTIPYSFEQRSAIESDSPLTLVQSGAGTGKSTVILARIKHMEANGVDSDDITVLSFTNAAANHISDLNPNVHSMTIASMLHTIYSTNFPTHQLSSLSTIINSIEIFYDPNIRPMAPAQKTLIDDFRHVLERLRDNNEYTKANNFVEDHVDDVIAILGTIEQTSLELEAIICYLKMDTLIEPPETKTKHLIIDEVQDNSIAEFIYCLQYTEKHNNSLYIVGDCSQTLYEFRSSDPKALNMLESSGVFSTYKLQTNYRSNQEILDFANIGLSNIDANKYANIQLHANSLKPVSLQSFKDAVTVKHHQMKNRGPQEVEDSIIACISVATREWVQDKLKKGEQVAILAPRRATLRKVEELLRKLYTLQQQDVVSLVPARQYDAAIFSKFIAKYWNQIKFTPPNNIMTTIRDTLMSRLTYMSYGSQANQQKTKDIATHMLTEFNQTHGQTVLQYQTQVAASAMTQRQMLDQIKKLMLTFEIKRNAVAQALVSNKNTEAKLAQDVLNAKFILSTIHSAKGLEFDNVIVFYDNEPSKKAIPEESKRMFYVAFTRAKKAEFIYSTGTDETKVVSDYKTICDNLSKMKNGAAGGVSNLHLDDDDDDDDTNVTVILPASQTPLAGAYGTDPDNLSSTDPDAIASTEPIVINDDGDVYMPDISDEDLIGYDVAAPISDATPEETPVTQEDSPLAPFVLEDDDDE